MSATIEAPSSERSPLGAGVPRGLVVLLAIACGAAVANLYYAQPLLDTIARAFDVSAGRAGLIVTGTQVGYAAGLVLLVPLGDRLDRRKLVPRLLVVCAAALALTAVAPSLLVLGLALSAVGVTTVVAQVLVPFAASLATDEERGRVVGTVMSGLLIGILLARTVAGLIAEVGGWRLVPALAAGGMLVLAAVLRRQLPAVPPVTDGLPYRRLLRSIWTLVLEEPQLRRRMAYGACGMAGFSILWTPLAFLLSDQPFGFSDAVIGLFGLFGLAGAGAAQLAGRLADQGRGGLVTGGGLLAILAGWGLCLAGTSTVWPLALGIVVLDLGVQSVHITSQSTIYELAPEARSRLTTAYMTSVFTGGALGSALASLAWAAGGWHAVCTVGAAVALTALLVFADERRRAR